MHALTKPVCSENSLLQGFLSSCNLQDKVRRILQIIKIVAEGVADKGHLHAVK
jgi:hypothetical protein